MLSRGLFPWFDRLALAMVLVSVMLFRSPLAAADRPVLPEPNAELTPGAIVELVIDALARNDQPFPNAGIETAFNFASPANKAVTGPLDRFVTLVNGPVFGKMVNHRDSTLSRVVVENGIAIRLVQIISADGETVYYAFRLSLQETGDYAGMWLTEAVWPLRNPDRDMMAL